MPNTIDNAPVQGAGDFTVELPRPTGGVTLDAANFGVSPSNDLNGAALTAAFREARRIGAARLRVAPGTYNCFDDEGVLAEGLADFTFDGGGAMFVFRRPSLVGTGANLVIKGCDHSLFTNFRMDWDWEHDPLASVVTVVGKHCDERDNESCFDVKFDRLPPCHPNPVPIQTMTTVDASRRHLIGTQPNRMLFGLYEGHFGPKNEWVEEDTLRIWPQVRPGDGFTFIPGCEWCYSADWNRSVVDEIKIGTVYRMLHYYYGKGGIHLNSNEHLTLRGIHVLSCRGFGLGVDGAQKFWRVEDFTLAPPPDKLGERLVSSTADGHHVVRSLGYCQYVNMAVSFCNDDSHNFHDCISHGVTEAPDTLLQTFVNGVIYLNARPGDEIELREANYAPTGWRGKVVSIDGKRLKMDRPVPAAPKFGVFLFFNRTFATSHILVKDCVCRDSHFRNLWQSGNLTVEGCTFERMGDGQHFLADWTHDLWCEGVGVENVVFRDCVFRDNNQQTRGTPCAQPEIQSYLRWPDDVKCDKPAPGFFKDFLFENCRFINPAGKVFAMRFVDGVTLRGNTVVENGAPRLLAESDATFEDCLGVKIEHTGKEFAVSRATRAPEAAAAAKGKPALVILAAGMGSRYGGIKQMEPVGPNGEIIMDYSIHDAIRAGFGKVVFVIRRDFEEAFRSQIGSRYEGRIDVAYAFQSIGDIPPGFAIPDGRTKPWGTAHAALAARDAVGGAPFAVINADDFYGRDAFSKLGGFLAASPDPSSYAMVGFRLLSTLSENGTVARGVCDVDGDGLLQSVTEMTKIGRTANGAIANMEDPDAPVALTGDELVSMNVWGFPPEFFGHLVKRFPEWMAAHGDEPKAEWYLPGVVNDLVHEGAATVRVLPTTSRWFGVTYREDRQHVVDSIAALVAAGEYPAM